MSLIDLIWREIMTPSDQIGPADAAYRAGMSALGHAMLGAAFASAFGLWGLAPALVPLLAPTGGSRSGQTCGAAGRGWTAQRTR